MSDCGMCGCFGSADGAGGATGENPPTIAGELQPDKSLTAEEVLREDTPVGQLRKKHGIEVVSALDKIWRETAQPAMDEVQHKMFHYFLNRGEESPQAGDCVKHPENDGRHILEFLAKLVLYAPEEWFTIITGKPLPEGVKNDYPNIGVAFDASSRLRRAGIEYYHAKLTSKTRESQERRWDSVVYFDARTDADPSNSKVFSLPKLPDRPSDAVRVVAVSDTHLLQAGLQNLPAGDILIHAGDLSYEESRSLDAKEFMESKKTLTREQLDGSGWALKGALTWLEKATGFEHKVLTGGNHDFILEQLGPAVATELCMEYKVQYLHTEADPVPLKMARGAELTVWGSGVSAVAGLSNSRAITSGNTAFQASPEDVAATLEKQTASDKFKPGSVDILVTHSPPQGALLGGAKGPTCINDLVRRVRPKLFLCGHAHNPADPLKERWANLDGVLGFNACVCGTWNHLHGMPIVIDLRPR